MNSPITKSHQNHSKINRLGGFTLLELSVFFMIAAALTLAIFKGKDLIFAYKVQATVKEYQEHFTAYRAFKSKYGYLPGDFPNATRIWPDLGSTDGVTTYSGNGDGNGFIDEGEQKFVGIQHYIWFMEGTYAWGHLSREGLVPGTYKGSPTPVCFDSTGACNASSALYKNTGYYITAGIHGPFASIPASIPTCDFNYAAASANASKSLECRGRPMWMARRFEWLNRHNTGYSRDSAWSQVTNVLTITGDLRYYGINHIHIMFPTFCSSAQILDNKIDDGKPFTGKVTADWPCRENRNGCEYGDCYTGKPSDWNYTDTSRPGEDRDSFINFLLGEGDL